MPLETTMPFKKNPAEELYRHAEACREASEVGGDPPCYEGPSLEGGSFEGVDLSRVFLPGVNLKGADLRGATLRGADLRGANLRGANLEGANLNSSCLIDADLESVDFQEARLSFTQMAGARIAHADFEGAKLGDKRLYVGSCAGVLALRLECGRAIFAYQDLSLMVSEGSLEKYGSTLAERSPEILEEFRYLLSSIQHHEGHYRSLVKELRFRPSENLDRFKPLKGYSGILNQKPPWRFAANYLWFNGVWLRNADFEKLGNPPNWELVDLLVETHEFLYG